MGRGGRLNLSGCLPHLTASHLALDAPTTRKKPGSASHGQSLAPGASWAGTYPKTHLLMHKYILISSAMDCRPYAQHSGKRAVSACQA